MAHNKNERNIRKYKKMNKYCINIYIYIIINDYY